MTVTRKLTVKTLDGSFDGMEISCEFPDVMGLPKDGAVQAIAKAMTAEIKQALGVSATPVVDTIVTTVDTVDVAADFIRQVNESKDMAELLTVFNKAQAGLQPNMFGPVKEAASKRKAVLLPNMAVLNGGG